jgi:hypothetical protein
VEIGHQQVDGFEAVAGRDEERGVAGERPDRALLPDRRLQQAQGRGADRDDAPAGGARGVEGGGRIGGDLAPLDTLLTVVQPPFFGQALNGKQTNQLHPLARLVDAARPDPSGRWLTERLVRRVVQNQSDSAAHDSLVTLLTRWKNLAGPINALALETPAIGEALPVVTALERTSVIGLDALAMIRARTTPTPAWLDSAAVDFKRFEGPQRLLRVAILSEIRKLVTLLQPMVQ